MFNLLPSYLNNGLFALAVFILGLLMALVFTPLVIRFAIKIGALDQGGYRKKHQTPTPVLGGLSILLSFLGIALILLLLPELTLRFWALAARLSSDILNALMNFAQERTAFRPDLLLLLGGSAATAFLGYLDDVKGLKPRAKLIGQILIALILCSAGRYLSKFYIPFFGGIELSPVWGVIVSSIWIVGLMNAFNLIDGVDGLAAGVGLITTTTLGILGAINGDPFMVLICSGLSGILLGFLFFNFQPARIFLGDTGSMLLGFLLATITLLGTYKTETAFILVAPILALSLPIFEAGISMLRRFVRGVPIFSADNYHTHHRLISRGLSERNTVLTLYAVTFLLSLSAILNNLIPEKSTWAWVPPFIYFGTLLWLTWWAGYLRPQTLGKIFSRRQRNSILTTLSRYAAQTISAPHHEVPLEEIFSLCRREIKLTCLEAWLEGSETIICSCRAPGLNQDGKILMKITSPQGKTIAIRYTFREGLSEEERIDAVACLAGIFEQADADAFFNREGVNLHIDQNY